MVYLLADRLVGPIGRFLSPAVLLYKERATALNVGNKSFIRPARGGAFERPSPGEDGFMPLPRGIGVLDSDTLVEP